jgi:hypothetical protein
VSETRPEALADAAHALDLDLLGQAGALNGIGWCR